MKTHIACLVLIVTSLPGLAQKDALIEAMRDHVYTMTLVDGRLSGAGGILLNETVSDAQFVLLGEQHGLAEVQAFGAALYRLAH
ncbi:MAG: hypothetical protein R3330_06145, partial [Saprospiraceae bacterium]|nr:hypothetical protein [Saprospiraceae bacterium]